MSDPMRSGGRDPMRSLPMVLCLVGLIALAGCAAAPRLPDADPGRPFDVVRFFQGRTAGTGQLKVPLRSPIPVGVESVGRLQKDGELVLTQRIREGQKEQRTREWRIREVAPGRYSGTLSDAVGPVAGALLGNRLRLGYRMKGGLGVEQWLALARDGQSVHNLLVVRKFGLTVARLDETIRKLE